jgi:hypothetical protein
MFCGEEHDSEGPRRDATEPAFLVSTAADGGPDLPARPVEVHREIDLHPRNPCHIHRLDRPFLGHLGNARTEPLILVTFSDELAGPAEDDVRGIRGELQDAYVLARCLVGRQVLRHLSHSPVNNLHLHVLAPVAGASIDRDGVPRLV